MSDFPCTELQNAMQFGQFVMQRIYAMQFVAKYTSQFNLIIPANTPSWAPAGLLLGKLGLGGLEE